MDTLPYPFTVQLNEQKSQKKSKPKLQDVLTGKISIYKISLYLIPIKIVHTDR